MHVLLDSSVRHHAVALKGEWVETGEQLWGGKIPIQTGYLQTIEDGIPVRETRGGDQTRYIASIASKKEELGLKFHTTDALIFETINKPIGQQFGFTYGDASLFAGVTIVKHVTLPELQIEIPGGSPIDELRQQIEKQYSPVFSEIWSALRKIKETDKSSQDAWHLTCAIELDMDALLTTDSKLHGQICSIEDTHLRDRLLRLVKRPFELCKLLDIEPLTDDEFEHFKGSLQQIF